MTVVQTAISWGCKAPHVQSHMQNQHMAQSQFSQRNTIEATSTLLTTMVYIVSAASTSLDFHADRTPLESSEYAAYKDSYAARAASEV